MKKIEKIIIPEVLKLRTFTENLHYYAYAEKIPKEDIFQNTNFECVIEIESKKNQYFKLLLLNYKNNPKFSDIYLISRRSRDIELLYVKKLYPYGNIFAHLIEHKNMINFYINILYFYLIRWKIENVLPPGICLRNLTYMLLLKNKFLSFHASSFAIDKDCACLVFGPPKIGKTLTVLRAMEDGMYYLSEDISVVKDGFIYSVPYTATHHHVSKFRLFGPVTYFIPAKTPLGLKFRNRILSKARLKYVFILEHSQKQKIIEIPMEKAIKKILILNRLVLNYLDDILVLSKLYFLGRSHNYIEHIEKILIENILKKSKVFILQTKNPINIYPMIKSTIF